MTDHIAIAFATTQTEYYDPRVWVREGEKTMSKRVQQACKDLNNVDV